MGKTNRKVNIALGLALALIAVAMVAMVAIPHLNKPSESRLYAVVHDGDGETHELALADDAQLVVATSKGTNVVTVQGGAAFVSEADCPNHDCMRQGRISEPGQKIICLPHELWVEVTLNEAASSDKDVDVLTR